jgi:hypothetical protein
MIKRQEVLLTNKKTKEQQTVSHNKFIQMLTDNELNNDWEYKLLL